MAIYPIPLADETADCFEFTTDLDGVDFTLTFRWNSRDPAWYMDITDAGGNVLLQGLRLSLDTPLTGRFRDLRLPDGDLMAIDTSNQGLEAGRYDLGNRVKLFYYDLASLTSHGVVTHA
jgi:hypothetical protein